MSELEGWTSFSIKVSTKRMLESLKAEMRASSFDEVIRRLVEEHERGAGRDA